LIRSEPFLRDLSLCDPLLRNKPFYSISEGKARPGSTFDIYPLAFAHFPKQRPLTDSLEPNKVIPLHFNAGLLLEGGLKYLDYVPFHRAEVVINHSSILTVLEVEASPVIASFHAMRILDELFDSDYSDASVLQFAYGVAFDSIPLSLEITKAIGLPSIDLYAIENILFGPLTGFLEVPIIPGGKVHLAFPDAELPTENIPLILQSEQESRAREHAE